MCLNIQVTTDYISRLLKEQNKHTMQKRIKNDIPHQILQGQVALRSLCVQFSLFIYRTVHCPDFPPEPIRIFKSVSVSRLDTQHSSLVRHNRCKKNVIGFKSRMQVYSPCSKISKPHLNNNQDDGYRMCSLAVNFSPSTCHNEQLHITCTGYLYIPSCKEHISVHLTMTAMVQENI